LQDGAVITREGNAPGGVDHAPPGSIAVFGQRRERPADGARCTGTAGESRDDAVGRDPAFGNVTDDAVDPMVERIHATRVARWEDAPELDLAVDGSMPHRVRDAR